MTIVLSDWECGWCADGNHEKCTGRAHDTWHNAEVDCRCSQTGHDGSSSQLPPDPEPRRHAEGCNGRLLTRWSGRSCRCGALWECY